MYRNGNRTTGNKIALFRQFFSGLPSAYGTYHPVSGQVRQVKAPVTDKVILSHLQGKQPYGVYLLKGDRTRAVVADFDTHDRFQPVEFMNVASHYKISSYIERSKSKGYHVWIFFGQGGVPACKARLVVKNILDEIEAPDTEFFPKQNSLESSNLQFGNFINAPLFGALVPKGKTVFIDPTTFKPYQDQWVFLRSRRGQGGRAGWLRGMGDDRHRRRSWCWCWCGTPTGCQHQNRHRKNYRPYRAHRGVMAVFQMGYSMLAAHHFPIKRDSSRRHYHIFDQPTRQPAGAPGLSVPQLQRSS